MVVAGWKIETLGHVATLQRGFDLPHKLRREGSFPIVTSSGVENYHHEARVKGPGVVTGRYGTIGEVFFIPTDFWPLNTSHYVRDFHGNDPLFISYLLRTIPFHLHSGKSGVPGVNRNDLHEIAVSLPATVTEQFAIAAALSDADALIDSLEKLIAKKRAIKQGAMQQLLTGKRRLPGFSGEWKTITLMEIAEVVSGATPSTDRDVYWDGSVHWCTPTDITGLRGAKYLFGTERRITELGLKSCAAQLLPVDSIVMTSRATIGECAINKIPVATNQGFKSLVPKGINVEFLFYMMLMQKARLIRLGNGSTFFEVGKKDVEELTLLVPPSKDEESAIAQVLSDMDAEIESLETKLAKARLVKQGMMQELLTGKVRLI